MTKFERAYYPPEAFDHRRYVAMGLSEAEAKKLAEKMRNDTVWKNDTYQVASESLEGGLIIHLSIKRIDRAPIHDWRDLQEIKNELCGRECEAVEIYPAESRKVDTANQYHLWVFPEGERIPLGFQDRLVMTDAETEAWNKQYGTRAQQR